MNKQINSWAPNVGDWVVIDNLIKHRKGRTETTEYNGKMGHVYQIGEIKKSTDGLTDMFWCTNSTYFSGQCLEAKCLRPALFNEIPLSERPSIPQFEIF